MSTNQDDKNIILPFQIEGQHISGRVARLSPLVNEILAAHDYPESVAGLLGEALVLAAMLGSTLKFDGRFIVQLQNGVRDKKLQTPPLTSLIAEYRVEQDKAATMRGCVQYDKDLLSGALASENKIATRLETLFGERGYMGLTVDQGASTSNYQGIVSLVGDTISQAALDYFARSAQIATALFVVARPQTLEDGSLEWEAAGILLQKMPHASGETAVELADPEAWERIGALLHTLTSAELLDADLPLPDLLWRLFHEEGVRVFAERGVGFGCPCSRERVYEMLMRLPPEADKAAEPTTEVTCEFCNKLYQFSAVELAETDLTDSTAN